MTLNLSAGTLAIVGGEAFGPLSGTGDGRLFVQSEQIISELSPATGATLQSWSMYPALGAIGVYAPAPAAFWAGDFLMFPSGTGQVVRFHTSDGSAAIVGALPDNVQIVAAASSTCAPLH